MQFSSREAEPASAQSPERSTAVDLKFTQTGKYLIAAGSERQEKKESFSPVLYLSLIDGKDWATQYPMRGSYKTQGEAAAAALHYGIQIITRQARVVTLPGMPGRGQIST